MPVLKVYLLLRYYGTGSVAVALFMHTEAIKSEGNAMEYPIGLGFVSNTIEIMAGLIPALCAFYLSSSYISKRHKVWNAQLMQYLQWYFLCCQVVERLCSII